MRRNETIKHFVIQTMIMPMSEIEALEYLDTKGFQISRQHYHRLKKNIKESRFDRLTLIAKSQFVDQHLERIDQLELVNQELWQQYKQEQNPSKKANILMQIAELQTFISPYYSASKRIMEMSIQDSKEEKPTTVKKKRKQQQDVETEKL